MTSSIITDAVSQTLTDEPRDEANSPPLSFIIAFTVTAILGALVVRPFAGVLFLAATLALAARPLVLRLSRRLRHRFRLAAAIVTCGILLAIFVPFAALASYAANEVYEGLVWAREELGLTTWHAWSLSSLPPEAEKRALQALGFLHLDAQDLQHYVRRVISVVQLYTPRLFGLSLATLGNLLVTLVAFYFFTCDGVRLVDVIIRLSPLRRLHTRELLQEFRLVSSASLLGMVVGAAMHSVVVTMGLFALGVGHILFFSVITLFAAFVPIVASGLVWIPTVGWLLLSQRWTAAGLFALWCVVAILLTDNVLKPMVMRGRITMHGGVAFLAIVGGVGLFGPVGVIAGPVVMAFLTAFIRIYQRDYLAAPQDERLIQ